MGPRLRRLGVEAVRFSAVNVVATVVAVVIFNVLVHGIVGLFRPGPLNGWPLTSWFIGNWIGMWISFYGSSRYAFRHREATGPGGGALAYTAVNLASFVIPMSCLWLTRNTFGWNNAVADNISANVVGAFLGMVFRFWAFRRFVFRKQAGTAPVGGPRPPEVRESGREASAAGRPSGPRDPSDLSDPRGVGGGISPT